MSDNVIIREIDDNIEALNLLEAELANSSSANSKYLSSFPVVYIHDIENNGKYQVYVGEANDLFRRTKEHYKKGETDASSWQHSIFTHKSKLFAIGHHHFNKSLTLDIENKLIEYLLACQEHVELLNGRGNPQTEYYPEEEFNEIFTKVWRGLRRKNSQLFLSESEIEKSAIFKASPLHKLTTDQRIAKEMILKVFEDSYLSNSPEHKLVFVEGDAGTGKTVLISSTFYELLAKYEKVDAEGNVTNGLKCCLLVNHDEQINVYHQIIKRLQFDDEKMVFKPTVFINNTSPEEPFDVAFVDEAHLLLTQGKQAYQGKNQLRDIMDRAKVTVIMFDPWQCLTTEQYWDPDDEGCNINQLREQAKAADPYRYIKLSAQLRMQAEPEVMDWINVMTKNLVIGNIPQSSKYEIKVFPTIEELDEAIQKKARQKETVLSRLVASYDWEYVAKKKPPVGEYFEVSIGKWHKPWNRELEKTMTRSEKAKIKGLAWAEQPQTLNEVGSTFTIQGFDLNYAGVILGPSVKYREGRIVFDPTASCNDKATRNRTLANGEKRKFAEEFLQHEFNILITRGVQGLYIYACDEALREALLKAQAQQLVDKNIQYPEAEDMVELPQVAEERERYNHSYDH